MRHRRYCNHCKRTDVQLVKAAKSIKWNIQYYMCNSCNNERMKKYYKSEVGKTTMDTLNRKYKAADKIKTSARQKLNDAVRRDKIIKPSYCSACLSKGRIEGHHYDYQNPLGVIWLCPPCHASEHALSLG